jgi:hypothetical protein
MANMSYNIKMLHESTVSSFLPDRESVPLLSEISHFLRVSQLTSENIMDVFGDRIKKSWGSADSPIVLICAYNEQEWLPRLLYGLSRSCIPLYPIIVNNNSTDQTGRQAAELGATVVEEERAGLIHALLTGFRFIAESVPQPQAIFHTDADSYPLSSWAPTLLRFASQEITASQGGQVFASPVFVGKLARDTFRTMTSFALDVYYSARGRVKPHGPNGVIFPDPQGEILRSITQPLTEVPVTGTDRFIHKRVKQAGGSAAFCFSLASLVFTQGDRYGSVAEILRTFIDPQHRRNLYQDWFARQPDGQSYVPSDSLQIGNYR